MRLCSGKVCVFFVVTSDVESNDEKKKKKERRGGKGRKGKKWALKKVEALFRFSSYS